MSNLNELSKEIHANAVEKGWWDKPVSFGEIIALCHSELSEALEEYRNGKPQVYFMKKDKTSAYFGENDYDECTILNKWNGEKLEGIATELADCIIRILDYCGKENIDIDKVVRLKHEYNKTRSYKHGGKAI